MNNIVRIVILQELLLNNMLDIQDLYQQRVSRYADKFVKVILNPLELKHIDNVVSQMVVAKKLETHHKADGASETKRFTNGLKGEFAVAKYLKLNIDELNTAIGNSAEFDIPDIPGYVIGVKTVEYGHFPVIHKENTYPQIICICHPNAADTIYICGLATVEVLNKYQHDDLILDPKLKAKGTKTGFWGFSELQEVSNSSIDAYKINKDLSSETVEVSRITCPIEDYKKTE